MAEERRLVVVGGGITGLSAAHAALLRGKEVGRGPAVTVLEGSRRFGGNLVTERAGGFLLDGGPDSWVSSKPHATALARELGLGKDLIGTNEKTRRYFIAHEGHLHPVPESLVLGVPTKLRALATTGLFSWGAKLRMAFEPFVAARAFEGDDDESIADFAARRLGREAADRLVAPLLGGISAGDASDLSVRAAFPQLVAMESDHGSLVRGMRAVARERQHARRSDGGGSAFVSLAGGVGQLVAALVDRVRAAGGMLRSETTATRLARDGETWFVETQRGDRIAADAVLLAVPAPAAAALLAGVDPESARLLGAVRFASTSTVCLGYRRADVRHPLDGVGFMVPRSIGRPILASTWVSSKWDGRAPEGHVLLRVFFGGASGEGVLGKGDEELEQLARDELRALMGLDAAPVLSRVFRFVGASAQMRVGHLATMRTLRERLEHVAPALRVAGGGYDGIGIPDCIRQGQDAGIALAV
jgi:oxygen-dependent protoporphyrinogen oxidase